MINQRKSTPDTVVQSNQYMKLKKERKKMELGVRPVNGCQPPKNAPKTWRAHEATCTNGFSNLAKMFLQC